MTNFTTRKTYIKQPAQQKSIFYTEETIIKRIKLYVVVLMYVLFNEYTLLLPTWVY